MPRMDGLELCRAIRTADLQRYLYFIMVTARDRPIDAISALGPGDDDYLVNRRCLEGRSRSAEILGFGTDENRDFKKFECRLSAVSWP